MWFGRPGSLVELPVPEVDISIESLLSSSVLTSLSGARTVQRASRSRRTFTFDWHFLSEDEAALIRAFYLRFNGPGPWPMILESNRNLLTPNLSSGTDVLADTTDFRFFNGGSIESDSSVRFQGRRSFLWTMPSSISSDPLLVLGWPGSNFGYPAIPNQWYAFSVYCSSNDSGILLKPKLSFYDGDGILISTEDRDQGATSGTFTVFNRLELVAQAPSNAGYIQVSVLADTAVASKKVWLDAAQLEMGQQVTDWVPGEGVPQITITNVPTASPKQGVFSLESVVFTEVG